MTPEELRDHCQVSHCRHESDLTYRGVGLCDVHWKEACAAPTIEQFLGERLVEAALLEVQWT